MFISISYRIGSFVVYRVVLFVFLVFACEVGVLVYDPFLFLSFENRYTVVAERSLVLLALVVLAGSTVFMNFFSKKKKRTICII